MDSNPGEGPPHGPGDPRARIGLRELRVRMLEALDLAVKQFRTSEALFPLRVPGTPLVLEDVIGQVLGADARRFEPSSLRARTLLQLRWDDGSAWALWVAILPSGLKLFCDTGDEESRVLASGGRNAGDESDRLFIERLSESRGDHFGIEMAGGPPSRVRSSVGDRAFLVGVFVDLFEGTDAEQAIRQGWDEGAGGGPPGRDFRAEVERWLDDALGAGAARAGGAAGIQDE